MKQDDAVAEALAIPQPSARGATAFTPLIWR
jgi:hypothetical protein